MRQLVFATNNTHKIEEVAAKVSGQLQILSLADISFNEDIAETGETFAENASIKSRFIYNKLGLNCFGDDSGLEVDALNGAPGVYSARYAGGHGNHQANMALLLKNLEGDANRSARFKTVISLMWNGQEHFFEGVVEGTIRYSQSGSGGFGYDPVFEPQGYETTFAEMPLSEKNKISHRAKAVALLLDFLKQAL